MQSAQQLQTPLQAFPRQLPSRKKAPDIREKDGINVNEKYEQKKADKRIKRKQSTLNCATVDCALQVFRKGLHWLVVVPQSQSVRGQIKWEERNMRGNSEAPVQIARSSAQ